MWTVNWFAIFISIIEGTAPTENSSQSGAGPGPVGVNVARCCPYFLSQVGLLLQFRPPPPFLLV
jgi:hypothetical protein